MKNKLVAEALGTFFLVAVGLSAALFSGAGIGTLGISLAFGLALMAMAYVVGPVSGCHLNPAVTIGAAIAGHFPKSDVIGYVIAQVVGGVVGAGAVYLIAKEGGDLTAMLAGGFASNGFAEHSPGAYSMHGVMMAEALATMLLVFVVLGTGGDIVPRGFAPIAIGVTLTLAHFMTIHISNASINPARSTATAVIEGGWALNQLWVFWVSPIVGGIVGGFLFKHCGCTR